jgi:hypothetical protein
MLPTYNWLQNRTMGITIQSQTRAKTRLGPRRGPLSHPERGFRESGQRRTSAPT